MVSLTSAAVTRLKSGDTPDVVLDDRFVEAFTIAGNAEDCRAQAAAYSAAGVTELALTFFGPFCKHWMIFSRSGSLRALR